MEEKRAGPAGMQDGAEVESNAGLSKEPNAAAVDSEKTDGREEMMSWSPRIPVEVRQNITQLAEAAGCSIGTMFTNLVQVYRTAQVKQRAADQEANIRSMEQALNQIHEQFNNVLEAWVEERDRADANEGAVAKLEKLQQELADEKKAREETECRLAEAEKKVSDMQTALETAKKESDRLSEINALLAEHVNAQTELEAASVKYEEQRRDAARNEVQKLQEQLNAQKKTFESVIRDLKDKLNAAAQKAAKGAAELQRKQEIITQLQQQFVQWAGPPQKSGGAALDVPGGQETKGSQ